MSVVVRGEGGGKLDPPGPKTLSVSRAQIPPFQPCAEGAGVGGVVNNRLQVKGQSPVIEEGPGEGGVLS